MPSISAKSLISKLNTTCRKALEASAGLCVSRTHYHVELEHWILKLVETADTDLALLFRQYGLDTNRVKRELNSAIDQFKTGNGRGGPDLSFEILDAIREGWILGSLEFGATKVRSVFLLVAVLAERTLGQRLRTASPELGRLNAEKVQGELANLLPHLSKDEAEEPAAATGGGGGSDGGPAPVSNSKTPALDQFTMNMTERARKNEIDPVIGRDREIRQVIDILTRRRQNNPILTGEAGVGKTAVVEGLALRIVAGDVPEPLKPVELRTLDLGLLQAGAGVKGEFENRLKSVIQEVKQSPKPVILFIDEAHTMIGAGGQAGQNDAANLLKPALARGELRTIAATTYDEYKKYFESDPALKRRFQEVRVDEPDETRAVRMLRGVAGVMEKHHGVRILDEALLETVRLGIRYLPERQLPDKAVSLLDTACARVKLSQAATPPLLEDTLKEIEHLDREIASAKREQAIGNHRDEHLADLDTRKKEAETKRDGLLKRLERERELVTKVRECQTALETAHGPDAAAAKVDVPKVQAELKTARDELETLQGEEPLVFPVVDAAVVSAIISGWTGIPIGNMVRNEIDTVISLPNIIGKRVLGQDHALEAIAQRIRSSRADLADPSRPIGVFLLVGPSGVGKTETALALADLLYGGDRNMVTINMSEFKEEYKVSQLIGSPRGYEGSSEGGVLTEAVRRRPYSVVLLDEVEKSHPSVQEIFYQVFDKGVLNDSRGIEVNFKNTIILLTSNVGTDTIVKACADPETAPDAAGMEQLLRPDLLKSFKPALLGRMKVVPYFPLSETMLKGIIELQLGKIGKRLKQNHGAEFSYSPEVVTLVASRCKEVESGARNVDHILTGSMLPAIATEVLTRMAESRPVRRVHVGIDGSSQFAYSIE
ncbi:type VI secretion system ATPase TssH [Zavarzinella formosa]|uniref:type VI secretion system ATPase TssH n=1 Tax=Zavarzinella formosa TaxID=360055 RepID=UPI0002D5A88B|nr:type VI secretion system ATPase TssH [Zavarzinella formosa]